MVVLKDLVLVQYQIVLSVNFWSFLASFCAAFKCGLQIIPGSPPTKMKGHSAADPRQQKARIMRQSSAGWPLGKSRCAKRVSMRARVRVCGNE